MATTNWAGLANAALQRLTSENAAAFQQTAAANALKARNTATYKGQNTDNVLRSSINANDRGMGRSGPEVSRRAAIAKSFAGQIDLTNRNNAGSLLAAAKRKTAAKTKYNTDMANIKAQQAAASMQRIAQLPAGINFAALKAMNGGK